LGSKNRLLFLNRCFLSKARPGATSLTVTFFPLSFANLLEGFLSSCFAPGLSVAALSVVAGLSVFGLSVFGLSVLGFGFVAGFAAGLSVAALSVVAGLSVFGLVLSVFPDFFYWFSDWFGFC